MDEPSRPVCVLANPRRMIAETHPAATQRQERLVAPSNMQIILLGLPWIAFASFGQPFQFQDRWSHTILGKFTDGTMKAMKLFGDTNDGLVSTMFAALPEYQKRGILSCAQQCRISTQIQNCERLIYRNSSFAMVRVARCLKDGFNFNHTEKDGKLLGFIYDFPVGGQPLVAWWHDWGSSLPLLNKVKCIRSLMRQLYGVLKLLLEDCKAASNYSFILHDLSMDNLVVQLVKDTMHELDLESGKLPALTLQDFGSIMRIDSDEIPATVKASFGFVPRWPPELNHFAETVGASLPLHSYDVFSAGPLILAFCWPSGILRYPEVFDSWWEMSKLKLLLSPQSLKRLSSCIDGHVTPQTASHCVNLHTWLIYREFFSQHLRSIRQGGQNRRKSLAQLIACNYPRMSWLDYVLGGASWHEHDTLFSFPLTGHVQALLDGWIRTSFDDLIWRSLSPDPTERPLPSEILTSLWFTDEALAMKDCEVEKTCQAFQVACPEMETPHSIISLFSSILMFLCMGIVTAFICIYEVFVTFKGGQSMSPFVWEPLGGIYVMFSSFSLMAWFDYGLIFWVIMAPLGLFTMLGKTLEIINDWKMKQRLLIAALVGCCLQIFGAYHVAGSLGWVGLIFQSFGTWKDDANFTNTMRNFLAPAHNETLVALKWLQFCEIMLYVAPLLPIVVLTYNLKIHHDTCQRAVSSN